MRDRHTNKGRGFGFVKMRFDSFEKAQDNQLTLLNINNDKSQGHIINNKRVDVKSTDNFVKPQPGQQVPGMGFGGGMGGMHNNFNKMHQPNNFEGNTEGMN